MQTDTNNILTDWRLRVKQEENQNTQDTNRNTKEGQNSSSHPKITRQSKNGVSSLKELRLKVLCLKVCYQKVLSM